MIVGLALPAGCSDEGVTAATVPANTSSDTRVYNNFGIIFEYPRGWTVSEMGMLQSQADDSSGLVQVTKGLDQLLQVAWLGMVEDLFEMSGGLELTLEDSFYGLTSDGAVSNLDKGEIVETSHWGHDVMYQDFIAEGYVGESLRGVVACFYCEDSERLYQVMTGNSGDVSRSVALTNFQQFLDSLICH